MIYLGFELAYPFKKSIWKSLYDTSIKLSKNKGFELQIMRDSQIIGLNFSFTTKEDHAGLRLSLALLFHMIEVQIYDGRHWDYENSCFEEYAE